MTNIGFTPSKVQTALVIRCRKPYYGLFIGPVIVNFSIIGNICKEKEKVKGVAKTNKSINN
jgi:hypothetical protein